jgi:hypothetical protein
VDIGGARDERELLETFRFLDAQLDRENAALLRTSESLETKATVIGRVAATKAEVFASNDRRSRRKAFLWTVAVVLLLLATTVAVIDALLGGAA